MQSQAPLLTLGLLPDSRTPWEKFVVGYGVQSVVLAFFVTAALLHPEVLIMPVRDYHFVHLVETPAPIPRPITIAQKGSFDLPSGPGYGNGTGGSRGARGVVASAGFGSGVATGDGSEKFQGLARNRAPGRLRRRRCGGHPDAKIPRRRAGGQDHPRRDYFQAPAGLH